ncbi:MAG: CpaF family protein [Dehalococcoidia bacterium]|nr:CpaF family protein [Dehalococcoidia bacterium]
MTQPWHQLRNSLNNSRLATLENDTDYEDLLHQRLIRELDENALRGFEPDQRRDLVERAARTVAADVFPQLVGDGKEEVVARVVDEIVGLGPIEPLLRDASISEVMVNAPDEVYYERDGVIYEADVVFRDDAHVMRVIDRIVATIGRHVDEASPMVDARLQDGSRVNVIIPPLVPKSPVLTIRKFRQDRLTLDDLCSIGTVTPEMGELLAACVKAKLNIVVSGGTGTGKTTLLNALSAFLGQRERIVTIEDPLELKLQQRHVISLEARPPSVEGKGEVTQRELVRNALRMRPDRILVGEVRGAEAFDMLQAMNTGHEGSLTTVHANSPRDALGRIEQMVMMAGFDLPIAAIREQMASALHVIIQIARLADGTRRVVHLTEVAGMEGALVTLQDIFSFRQAGIDADGRVLGDLKPTGIRPAFADRLAAYGIGLEHDIFDTGRWR